MDDFIDGENNRPQKKDWGELLDDKHDENLRMRICYYVVK
jgi:hypothetical protein